MQCQQDPNVPISDLQLTVELSSEKYSKVRYSAIPPWFADFVFSMIQQSVTSSTSHLIRQNEQYSQWLRSNLHFPWSSQTPSLSQSPPTLPPPIPTQPQICHTPLDLSLCTYLQKNFKFIPTPFFWRNYFTKIFFPIKYANKSSLLKFNLNL